MVIGLAFIVVCYVGSAFGAVSIRRWLDGVYR